MGHTKIDSSWRNRFPEFPSEYALSGRNFPFRDVSESRIARVPLSILPSVTNSDAGRHRTNQRQHMPRDGEEGWKKLKFNQVGRLLNMNVAAAVFSFSFYFSQSRDEEGNLVLPQHGSQQQTLDRINPSTPCRQVHSTGAFLLPSFFDDPRHYLLLRHMQSPSSTPSINAAASQPAML